MSPEVYHFQKQRCIALLRQHYLYAASPVEGPAKLDHGDLDILVCEPRPDSHMNTLPAHAQTQAIATLLDAVRSIIPPAGVEAAANLAIPWPADAESLTKEEAGNKYIQVDVRVCDTLKAFNWMLFKHAHGDLWNLLGSMIRQYGLTVNDTGMYVRIPEVEQTNKNRAKVFLTSEPDAVLSFLDLPKENFFDGPFSCIEDLYEYASRCRLMYIPATESREEEFLVGKANLKANDRRRMTYRPVFKRWIEEFIPQCRAQRKFSTQVTSRGKVTEEALDLFHVREEYTKVRREYLIERQRDKIWNDVIKNSVPPADPGDQSSVLYRACLVKALKRLILERDESYGVMFEENMLGENGFYDLEKVRAFIVRVKDEVGEAAMNRHDAAYLERCKKKEAEKKK